MNGIVFVMLLALVFFVVFFHRKIRAFCALGGSKASGTTSDELNAPFPVISDFANVDECLPEDCDVTYKNAPLRSASSLRKIEYALASNDEKNSPKYSPTGLQDIYPSDPA